MVILSDPIFKGMAISLFFGVLVATLLTLLIIPLGCVSAKKAFATGPDDGSPGGSDFETKPEKEDEVSGQPIVVSMLAGIGGLLSWILQMTGRLLQVLLNVTGALGQTLSPAKPVVASHLASNQNHSEPLTTEPSIAAETLDSTPNTGKANKDSPTDTPSRIKEANNFSSENGHESVKYEGGGKIKSSKLNGSDSGVTKTVSAKKESSHKQENKGRGE